MSSLSAKSLAVHTASTWLPSLKFTRAEGLAAVRLALAAAAKPHDEDSTNPGDDQDGLSTPVCTSSKARELSPCSLASVSDGSRSPSPGPERPTWSPLQVAAAASKAASTVSPKYPATILLQLRALMMCVPDDSAPKYSTAPRAPSSEEPRALRPRPCLVETDEDQLFVRSVRSILNKLTVEKFDALYERLVNCGIRTPEHLALLMREIFEKATLQHHFVVMYADLCVALHQDSRIAIESQEEDIFRTLLLNQCQSAFEELLEKQAEVEVSGDEEEAELRRLKQKQRALGNVKLLAHLMVRGMVNSKLIIRCCQDLLLRRTTCPDALESLATLLTVAGPTFDQSLEAVFAEVAVLTRPCQNPPPPRVVFLLRDVLDLRAAGWAGGIKAPAPMRLQEVREANSPQASARQDPRAWEGYSSLTGRAPASPSSASQAVPWPTCAPTVSIPKGRNAPAPALVPALSPERPRQSQSSPHGAAAALDSLLAAMNAAPARAEKRHGQAQVVLPPSREAARLVPPPPRAERVQAPEPEVAKVATECQGPSGFSLPGFRRFVSETLRNLGAAQGMSPYMAVRRIKEMSVPRELQAREFADLLTRATEEPRGLARRGTYAFIAGLAASNSSAFDRTECLEGCKLFFADYEELSEEVPRLDLILKGELLPTLRSAFSDSEINTMLPAELQY